MMIYDTNRLAQLIRQVDQHNQLGPVALADALMPILAERFEEELDRRAAHAHDALMWVATALAAVGHEDKAIIMEGRSRTVKDILEEATTVLSSDDASPLGALCARIHVRSTDTYPELSVEVVDGSHLQPSDSPIHVYALPPAKQLVLHGPADLPSLSHPDAWLLTRASGTRWAVTDEPTQTARAVYGADNVTIDELVLRRNVMLPPPPSASSSRSGPGLFSMPTNLFARPGPMTKSMRGRALSMRGRFGRSCESCLRSRRLAKSLAPKMARRLM